jgi:hypothetical protein
VLGAAIEDIVFFTQYVPSIEEEDEEKLDDFHGSICMK